MTKGQNGKGDAPRQTADQEKYADGFDRIFGGRSPEEKIEPTIDTEDED